MRFDPTPDEIDRDFDEQARALVAERYYYSLSSYEVRGVSYSGTDSSFSSTHSGGYLSSRYDYYATSSGSLGDDQVTNDMLVVDVDAAGNVTRVSFPHVEIELAITSSSKCSRFHNGETTDCSDTWEWVKSVHTQGGMSGEDECYEAQNAGEVEVSGGCQIPWQGDDGHVHEEYGFRWSLMRFRPGG
jgi:hypothetical protein